MDKKTTIRNNWTKEEIEEIYHLPLMELIYKAATVHREWHDPSEVQISTLLSIKTGGCPEDCSYCGQAARYHTNIKVQALLPTETVIAHAQKAKDSGSSRFCMAAAWREVRNNRDFDRVIDMVKGVNDLGMEVCCTLGMLTEEQAIRLQEADYMLTTTIWILLSSIMKKSFPPELLITGSIRSTMLEKQELQSVQEELSVWEKHTETEFQCFDLGNNA
jgi:biotin synthase-like enzyme